MTKRKKIKVKAGLSLQIDNFILVVKTDGVRNHLEIRVTSGVWKTIYYDDNLMYGRIVAMMQEPDFKVYLSAYLFAIYTMCNNLPDWDFLNVYAKEFTALMDRYEKAQKETTEEEEAKVVEELKVLEEMREATETGEIPSAESENETTEV